MLWRGSSSTYSTLRAIRKGLCEIHIRSTKYWYKKSTKHPNLGKLHSRERGCRLVWLQRATKIDIRLRHGHKRNTYCMEIKKSDGHCLIICRAGVHGPVRMRQAFQWGSENYAGSLPINNLRKQRRHSNQRSSTWTVPLPNLSLSMSRFR